jgi:hypothetical protein
MKTSSRKIDEDSHDVRFFKMHGGHIHNVHVDEDLLRQRMNNAKDEVAWEKKKQHFPNVNEPIEVLTNEIEDKQIPNKKPVQNMIKKRRGQPHRFLAYDGGGFGPVVEQVFRCADANFEVEVTGSRDRLRDADIAYFHMTVPSNQLRTATPRDNKTRPQYVMVFTMEPEVYSPGGDTWLHADFKMYYHLELSWPAPATFLDVHMHLSDLLAPERVPFEAKESGSPIVWVVSNCAAYNARERFMKKLMEFVGVDSYGGCLKNKFTHPDEHHRGNIELYAKYKFVISIENSNCEDYVTEKLVKL